MADVVTVNKSSYIYVVRYFEREYKLKEVNHERFR